MKTLIATIQPGSAFGGAIRGDTLFGQLCWVALHRWGEQRLNALLQDYTQGAPFLVVSDAFPAGYLPRPALPMHRYAVACDANGHALDRKTVRKRCWLPLECFTEPLREWLQHAVAERQIAADGLSKTCSQPHNTINRMTGTTGNAEFAPYNMPQQWFAPDQGFALYIAIDNKHISHEEVCQLLADVGAYGYGRDASIGLGKFKITSCEQVEWPQQANPNAWMTLAPCAPQGLDFNPDHCWYQPFTRFGRHGDRAVHSGRPFKTPVLLADTAALLQPADYVAATFCGQGLGGDGSLSNVIEETVHQGYAPVLPVRMEETA